MGKIVLKETESKAQDFETCEVVKPTIRQLKEATRIASQKAGGGEPDGFETTLILIQLCTTFDGQKWQIEDIEKLDVDFFTKVSALLGFASPGAAETTAAV